MESTFRAAGFVIALAALVLVSAVAGRLLLPDLSWVLPVPQPTAAAATGCPSTSVVGRYYSNEQSGQFLDFRSDGTVFMSVGGGAATYAVDGATVVINTTLFGAARANIPSSIVVPACHYNGPDYDAIFFAAGLGSAQTALKGSWVRR